MSTPNGPEHPVDAAEQRASIERRREALRRLGRAGAAAGAASPMAALATGGGGRKWCHDKYKTKKVHASVSGMNSVVMSADPSDENYGKPCGHYGSAGNIPSVCGGDKKFSQFFTCGWQSRDSRNVVFDNSTYSKNNCLFHKTITQLCGSHGETAEAGWMTAYCNAAALHGQGKFPYSMSEVRAFWDSGDLQVRASAQTFFRGFMEHG